MNKRRKLRIEKRKRDKAWADAVKARDSSNLGEGPICVICGSKVRVNAHHLIPREVKELRWDVMNGVSLCPRHHRFSYEFSAHQNPLPFFLWMMEHRPEQWKYLKDWVEKNQNQILAIFQKAKDG